MERNKALEGIGWDFNELKATLRTGMGACGGKTCTPLIERIFAEEGIKINEVSPPTIRPFTTEVPMGIFAGVKECSKHGSGESE